MSSESRIELTDRRSDLRRHPIEPWYRSGEHALVSDFYVPCLERSIHYDRTAGYFDTRAFSLAADGLAQFIENGGRIRLVVSPRIRTMDMNALLPGSFEVDDVLESTIGSDGFRAAFANLMRSHRFAATNWLVDRDVLDVRIAFVTDAEPFGHYHEKCGIFVDRHGNRVAFTGSVNETGLAWDGNHETIEVYRSWSHADLPRVERKAADFCDLWNDTVDGLTVIPLEEAMERGVGFSDLAKSAVKSALTNRVRNLRTKSPFP